MELPWDSSFPSSYPNQSRSPPPKITYSAKCKEHRTLTHPLCYEVLETWPVLLKKKRIITPLPPPLPISVSIPKKLSIISWSSIRSKAKVLLSNCIRSLDYLCVNRLRQHISWWGEKFLLRRWSKILWWQRPVVLPTGGGQSYQSYDEGVWSY